MASDSVDNAEIPKVGEGSPPTICPHFHAAVELIGRRWAGVILASLLPGPLYFRQLGEAVPEMSDRLLSQRLRELEAEGLVERAVHEGPPARVSYGLTEAGRDLRPALDELHAWAKRWESASPADAPPPG